MLQYASSCLYATVLLLYQVQSTAQDTPSHAVHNTTKRRGHGTCYICAAQRNKATKETRAQAPASPVLQRRAQEAFAVVELPRRLRHAARQQLELDGLHHGGRSGVALRLAQQRVSRVGALQLVLDVDLRGARTKACVLKLTKLYTVA